MLSQLSNDIVRNVFPEEKRRFFRFLQEQKRKARSWLAFFTSLAVLLFLLNIQVTLPYLMLNFQKSIITVLFFWILAIVLLPFIWPFKKGDYFAEDFKRGLDPRIWQFEGDWKVELDEDGNSVLTVTNSNIGGIALPYLHWTDYEFSFDMRILNHDGGWIIRASGLYDYVHQKIDRTELVTFYRIAGHFPEVGRIVHGKAIDFDTWYPVRLLARGEWLSVYLTIEGKEALIFQDRALGDKPPVTVLYQPTKKKQGPPATQAVISPSFRSGSFGFRVHGEERAQYRRIRVYRLR